MRRLNDPLLGSIFNAIAPNTSSESREELSPPPSVTCKFPLTDTYPSGKLPLENHDKLAFPPYTSALLRALCDSALSVLFRLAFFEPQPAKAGAISLHLWASEGIS
jgi:hypothetical protein